MATVTLPVPILSAATQTSNIPELVIIQGTNFPLQGWAFGVANEAIFPERLVINNYGSGSVSLLLDWQARTVGTVTGSVTWGGAVSVITPGDAQSVNTDAFAAENTQATTTSATGNGMVRTTITLSNLDSLAAMDSLQLRIRTTAFTSFSGDAILLGATLQYSDV